MKIQVITNWSPGVNSQPIKEGEGFYFPKEPLSKAEAKSYVCIVASLKMLIKTID